MASGEGEANDKAEGQQSGRQSEAGKGGTGMTAGERLAAQKAAKAARKAASRGRDAEVRETEAIKRAAGFGAWVRRNARILVAAVAALVIVAGGVTGYAIHRHQQAEDAAQGLWNAIQEASAADQTSGDTGDETSGAKEPGGERRAASFEKVARDHAGAPAALWARLGEGRAHLDADRPEKARAAFEEVFAKADAHPYLATRALEGIAFTYETEENWSEAAARYESLAEIDHGSFENLSDYHLARIQAAQENVSEAKKTLRALIDRLGSKDAPDRPYVDNQARERLTALDPGADVSSGAAAMGSGASAVRRSGSRSGAGASGLGQGTKMPGKGARGFRVGGGGGGQKKQLSKEKIQRLLQKLKKKKGGQPGAASESPGSTDSTGGQGDAKSSAGGGGGE